jgi:polyisoprenoid-binding protein YceI
MVRFSWVVPALVGTLFAMTFSIVGAQGAPRIDLNHTSAHFAAKHLLISTVQGYVPVKSVAVTLGKDYVPTSVEAQMDLSKIDTHNGRRDNDLRSQRFLAVEQYPDMTFKSTKITPQGAGKFSMVGLLTIRGVTKPVTLDGNVVGSVKDDKGRTHVGYSATATIDRTQWGVGSTIPGAIVGNAVQITIEAEAIL